MALFQKKIKKSGSVNIPVMIRRDMGIQNGDAVEINVYNGKIELVPAAPRCCLCQGQDDIFKFSGRYICKSCIDNMYTNIHKKEEKVDE